MEEFSLNPLEKELLNTVSELDARLTSLEVGWRTDATTAQAQKTAISDKLRDLTAQLSSLPPSSDSLPSLHTSLCEFEEQYAVLLKLFAEHMQRHNQAIASCQAVHQIYLDQRAAYLEQKAAYEVLCSQVERLSAALRSLPPPRS